MMHLNGGKLITAAILAGLALGLAFFVRGCQTAAADRRICAKVDKLDFALIRFVQQTPVPSAPAERAQRNRFLAAMRAAACDPNNLP